MRDDHQAYWRRFGIPGLGNGGVSNHFQPNKLPHFLHLIVSPRYSDQSNRRVHVNLAPSHIFSIQLQNVHVTAAAAVRSTYNNKLWKYMYLIDKNVAKTRDETRKIYFTGHLLASDDQSFRGQVYRPLSHIITRYPGWVFWFGGFGSRLGDELPGDLSAWQTSRQDLLQKHQRTTTARYL